VRGFLLAAAKHRLPTIGSPNDWPIMKMPDRHRCTVRLFQQVVDASLISPKRPLARCELSAAMSRRIGQPIGMAEELVIKSS
jgi:hypothetical protein